MTDPATIASLADRIEKLTGPDREVDAEIHYDLLGWCRHSNKKWTGAESDTGFDCLDCGADSWGNKSKRGQGLYDKLPAYTASIDSAMTLVPEGWKNNGAIRWPGYIGGAYQNKAMVELHHDISSGGGPKAKAFAATPALALCAAALRAILQEEQK